ncbi:hypothetical protein THMIRHAS_11560 [Thiosulfatimonas sediminis]|uniref:Diguanylate phosphodiesterase n=1 Tax=Thiosulfatimonas sediminis TaxID=2675054 RepID=A0A6F8PUG8_9GAMM|nr:HDOD domain-containing protein [Thiosulfatimonas sediminis]BBP45783.1 hypothetical protein THMIRHAS_11560 [Thiosulfatimonas sediminis]
MHHNLILNKLPILDADKKLYAYQLNVTPLPNLALQGLNWEEESQALWAGVEEHIGLDVLTAGKPVFYQAPIQMLSLDLLPAVEPLSQLYVEVNIDFLSNKKALAAIKEIMQAGVKIALTDFEANEANEKLLSIAKLVKIHPQGLTSAALQEMIGNLRAKNLQVVLMDVETEEMFEILKQQGGALFQGYFFTNPIVSTQQEVASNKLAMLKLLGEVNNPDAEFSALAAIIGSDVGLTHKLLAAINHPQNNLPYVVESLKEAVNFMGLKRLKFWVNMLMLSEVDDVPMELLVTALVRGKFLESIAETLQRKDEMDRYFMVGLFSTLNAFLKAPMVDIIDELPISDEVKSALVSQEGKMGKALFVARAMEQGNIQLIFAGFEGLDIMAISSNYMDASGWARKTLDSLKAA